MMRWRNTPWLRSSNQWVVARYSFCIWVIVGSLCRCSAQSVESASPEASAYIAAQGGTLAPAGRLEIDGRRMACGRWPTVLDPSYADFGGAHARFIVLNPRLFAGLATPVKLWIFSHECAHKTLGADEVNADCAAVQRGRGEGWLTASGLEQVCEFMRPARQDHQHFNGAHRCELMRRCFQAFTRKPRQ